MASDGREVGDGSDTSSFFSTGKAPCSGGSSSAFGADALGSGRVVTGRGWLEARPQQLSTRKGFLGPPVMISSKMPWQALSGFGKCLEADSVVYNKYSCMF